MLADIEAEVVDRAVGGEGFDETLAFVDAVATLDHLVEVEPQPEGEGTESPGSRMRLADLTQEATTIVETAAVLVGAQVGGRREEPLHDVVVVGVDLDRVDTGVDGDSGRLAVLADQPADLVVVECRGRCGGRRSR